VVEMGSDRGGRGQGKKREGNGEGDGWRAVVSGGEDGRASERLSVSSSRIFVGGGEEALLGCNRSLLSIDTSMPTTGFHAQHLPPIFCEIRSCVFSLLSFSL
jgi:hypothetical protein